MRTLIPVLAAMMVCSWAGFAKAQCQSQCTNSNTFFGRRAGVNNTSSFNTFFGANAGQDNNGFQNSFFGTSSGGSNTTGNINSFFGVLSGFSNTSGSENSFFGDGAGQSSVSGSRNSFFGRNSGKNAEGSGNVFLGYRAGFNERGSNKLYIANDATDSPLIHGEFDNRILTVNGQMGIGIDRPEHSLHVRATDALFRIDRDREDPGFVVVRYDEGFNSVLKSFTVFNHADGINDGKFVIADGGTQASGTNAARLIIDNEGNVGVGERFQDLENDATARLHVDGTVRLQNLPEAEGHPLVIDAEGNVSRSNTATVDPSETAALRLQVRRLKRRLARLEALVGDGCSCR